jgi:large repetitive protein
VTPTITGITPSSAQTGDLVMVTGTTFNGATDVSFNGVSSGFTLVNPSTIQATVPATATFGPITVTTPGGTASSTDFSLLPKIQSFSPTSGATGTQVTITGSGFGSSVTDVKFNGQSADPASINRVSPTQVQATVPKGASTGQITVVTSGGTDISLGEFSVRLSVTNLSPANGAEGSHVEIDGSGFTSTSVVNFTGPTAAGVDATTITVNPNGNSIDAVVPAGALTGPIKVTNTGSGLSATSAQSFTVGPVITGFSVTHGVVGDSVTINGRNLQGTTQVDFDGIVQTGVTVNGAGTSITTTVPAGADTGLISLQTPLFVAHSPSAFTVVPKITSFSPTSGAVGASVTLTGTRMSLVTAVDFNGAAVSDFTLGGDDNHLVVTVPTGASTGKVTVKETSGLGTTSTGDFTIVSGVTGFSPASGTAGTDVTITGTDLGSASVTFNGISASITSNTATTIHATVPAGATTGSLVVTTASATIDAGTFLVPATIASFSPLSGSGADAVTIHGTGFTNVSAVAFNLVPVSSYTVVDGGTITTSVPATATTGKITVTTDAGTAQSAADFTVNPVVDSISSSTALTGQAITVTGRNLGAVTGVDVGGVPGTFWTISPTQVGVTVPDAAVTGPVSVHTLASGAPVVGPTLTVLPAILGFAPVSASPGDTITITGTGLKDVVSVGFAGSVSAAPATTAAQSLTVAVPTGATTGPVTVTDGTHNATSDDQFKVLGP